MISSVDKILPQWTCNTGDSARENSGRGKNGPGKNSEGGHQLQNFPGRQSVSANSDVITLMPFGRGYSPCTTLPVRHSSRATIERNMKNVERVVGALSVFVSMLFQYLIN